MMMRKRVGLALVVAAAAVFGGDARHAVAAQAGAVPDGLKRQIERRFEVLPLTDGLALRPRSAVRGVRSIEIAGGTIAIDGVPSTGAELRDKLGADADLVLRLSYLDADARRAMFGPEAPPAPAQPSSEPSAAPIPPEPPLPTPARSRHSDARVRIGGSVTVDADESVEDVVVIGGSAHVMGEVTGDVVVIGGTAYLGPGSDVRKDVTIVGGSLDRDPKARVGGRVNEVGPGVGLHGLRFGRTPFGTIFLGSMWGGLFAFISTMIYLAILCLFGFLVVLINRDYVEKVAARAAADPVKAGVVGLLAQLLFLPLLVITIILLVITLVGIPLLVLVPFAVLGLIVFCFVGFTAVAYRIGGFVSARMGSALNPYMTAVAGIVVVMLPVLIGRVLGIGGAMMLPLALPLLVLGFLAQYLAWTVGFGAVALNRFDKRGVVAEASGR